MNIDLMSFTAHKIYGPKGIGALYARRRGPRVKPAPVIHGGGHERGIRSGTLNVPAIVGFEKALDIARNEMVDEGDRLRDWTNWMFEELLQAISGIERNGHPVLRLPQNLNIYVPGVESRAVVLELRDLVAFSTGSACTTAEIKPSHVIRALGFSDERAHSSFRFGLGRFTTKNDMEVCIRAVSEFIHATYARFKSGGLTARYPYSRQI